MESNFWTIFAIFVFLCVKLNSAEVKEGVIILKGPDFEETIKAHPFMLIEFASKNEAPLDKKHWLAQAAAKLKEKDVDVALAVCQKDCVKAEHKTSQYDMKRYVFVHGEPTEYIYGEMDEFIPKYFKLQMKIWKNIFITNKEQVEKMKETVEPYAIGFFKDLNSAAAKAYKGAITRRIAAFKKMKLKIVSNEDLFKEFDIDKNDVIIGSPNTRGGIEKFNVKRDVFADSFTVDNIDMFFKRTNIELVPELREDTGNEITDTNYDNFVVLFVDPKADNYDHLLDMFGDVALKFRMKAMFTHTDITSDFIETGTRFKKLLGITGKEKVHLSVLNFKEQKNYNYNGSLENIEDMAKFVDDAMAHKLEPFKPSYKMTEIPEDFDKLPIKPLNREVFMKIVDNRKENYLISLCTNLTCELVDEVFERLGERYKGSETKIGRIDVDKNELDFHANPPAIILVDKENGGGVIEYEHKLGENTVAYEPIVVFIETKGEIKPWEHFKMEQFKKYETEADRKFNEKKKAEEEAKKKAEEEKKDEL